MSFIPGGLFRLAGTTTEPSTFSSQTMNTTLTKNEPQQQNGTNRVNYLTPLANILETKDAYVLEAEMPGVNKDGLEVTVENGELTILGHRAPAETRGREVYRESRAFDYRRTFELDPSINTAAITAKIEQGVLKLQLPKAEAVKPRKIAVHD
jgi:HSP20 family protein